MNQNVNGSNHGGPLHLNAKQRAAILHKAGIHDGWVLLSVSEMFNLKRQMEGATAENERLNKQTARIVAQKIIHDAVADKALRSARGTFALFAEMGGCFAIRSDALREVANIDEALSILPAPGPATSETEKKEDEK